MWRTCVALRGRLSDLVLIILGLLKKISIVSLIAIANILCEAISHILVLLIATRYSLSHTFTHVVIVSAVAALNLALFSRLWLLLLLTVTRRVVVFIIGIIVRLYGTILLIIRFIWGRFNLEANIVVNL